MGGGWPGCARLSHPGPLLRQAVVGKASLCSGLHSPPSTATLPWGTWVSAGAEEALMHPLGLVTYPTPIPDTQGRVGRGLGLPAPAPTAVTSTVWK